jgi:hypothetical protein
LETGTLLNVGHQLLVVSVIGIVQPDVLTVRYEVIVIMGTRSLEPYKQFIQACHVNTCPELY